MTTGATPIADLSVTSPGEEESDVPVHGGNETEPHPGVDGQPVRCTSFADFTALGS
jgi:hypothetical protein